MLTVTIINPEIIKKKKQERCGRSRSRRASVRSLAPGRSYSQLLSVSHKPPGPWCSDCLQTNCALTMLTLQLLRSVSKPAVGKAIFSLSCAFCHWWRALSSGVQSALRQWQVPIDNSLLLYTNCADRGWEILSGKTQGDLKQSHLQECACAEIL